MIEVLIHLNFPIIHRSFSYLQETDKDQRNQQFSLQKFLKEIHRHRNLILNHLPLHLLEIENSLGN